jgi:hypothetical protein
VRIDFNNLIRNPIRNPIRSPHSAIRNLTAATALALIAFTSLLSAQRAIPRTPDGRPDLQGMWLNDTVTMLERPSRFGDQQVFSEQEAIAYEQDLAGRWKDRFGDLELTTTGELSPEWQEHGTVVPGRRTSLIVDPPNGQVPLRPDVRARAQALAAELDAHPADDPEVRTLYERCLLGSAGPPMMPPAYNHTLQIVQTGDRVMILTEMIHDARIVRMNAAHLPPAIRLWLGDSIGRWDGDTLVIDTTNFTNKTRWRQSGEALHIVERFTPESHDTIRYDFSVEDPSAYTQIWRGSLAITRTTAAMYEYACHEGNYSLAGILRGARSEERRNRGER